MPYEPLFSRKSLISRRTAVRAGVAASAAVTVGAVSAAHGAAQEATPPAMGMATEHLEVDRRRRQPGDDHARRWWTARNGATISILTGRSTPPATPAAPRLGNTTASGPGPPPPTTPDATYQRLTTVQFRLEDGSIMGLINEVGPTQVANVGAVQGRNRTHTPGALGTF